MFSINFGSPGDAILGRCGVPFGQSSLGNDFGSPWGAIMGLPGGALLDD